MQKGKILNKLDEYKKKKEFLICIDSDGCAMDTMDIKHIRCFGPCMIEEWNLTAWEAAILKRWNDINLYTITRGINRFQGLEKILKEVHNTYTKIEDIEVLTEWVEKSPELSNRALKEIIKENHSIILKKALLWSEKVNHKIHSIPAREKKPFEGVKEALSYLSHYADLAIVSSANLHAVEEEWNLYHLLDYVDILLSQENGNKRYHIQELLKKGYEKSKVLMVGDAMGDYRAAKKNGVFYYPILVRHEMESWKELKDKAIEKLIYGTYAAYQEEKLSSFMDNLKQE